MCVVPFVILAHLESLQTCKNSMHVSDFALLVGEKKKELYGNFYIIERSLLRADIGETSSWMVFLVQQQCAFC
jgi:hypothetical protein